MSAPNFENWDNCCHAVTLFNYLYLYPYNVQASNVVSYVTYERVRHIRRSISLPLLTYNEGWEIIRLQMDSKKSSKPTWHERNAPRNNTSLELKKDERPI